MKKKSKKNAGIKRVKTRSETGAILKNWTGRIRVALVYPNTYEVGMSNLGFQRVYALFNKIEDVVCERVFLPLKPDDRVASVESQRPIGDFHIIAFSVSFENDYLNILSIIKAAGLPLFSHARGDSHPLILAGGVACTLNPEPVSPFIDGFLMGEGEEILENFFKVYSAGQTNAANLEQLALNLTGAYIPSFYEVSYNSDNTIRSFKAKQNFPEKIIHVVTKTQQLDPSYTIITTPETTFSDTFLIEVTRGCPHGCRFCSAGFIYRPPRFSTFSKVESLINNLPERIKKTGLVGAAVSDYPDLTRVCELAEKKGLQVSFSSLRVDALTPELIGCLAENKVKTATLAPEAGSERMRRVINKGITETQILLAAKKLVKNAIPNLKLYFMIGLPTETLDDIQAIIDLSQRIKDEFLKASRPMKRIGQITVSINPFIPKPLTPFQWSPMDPPKLLKKKIRMIKDGLRRVPNVRVHADTPKGAYVNALLSRGDRRVADTLVKALENGGNWAKAMKEAQIHPDFYTIREHKKDQILPWDHIDHGIKKSFLQNEFERALNNTPSPTCPMKPCCDCGICMTTGHQI